LLADNQPWLEWSWIRSHPGEIIHDVVQHVELTLIAVGIGLAIALPLGYVAWRWRIWEKPIYGVTGLLFTIPSIALFGLLVTITGPTTTSAEIGLVSYTLLILVRNVVAGLNSVPPEVRDAARGVGYGPARQLLRVDLPLATPTIMAGIRLAVVTTIGLVTVASLIGAGGGLGSLIYLGFQTGFRTQQVLGAALSVLLAFVLDAALLAGQWALTPWTHKRLAR
jgi:osmoprotectant transport system permease protein